MTIAAPVAQALSPEATVAQMVARGPSAFSVLSASDGQASTPTTLLSPGAEISRDAEIVSRSLDRNPLPDCSGVVRTKASNGELPTGDLCVLWDGKSALRGDAARALTQLNDNFAAVFGKDLCITDSYRPLAVQRRLAYTKPGLAATPGTSNHGWGLAVDLCSEDTHNRSVMAWLSENGPTFGWANPAWARRGGSGAYEPWHWEYVPGTTELGTTNGGY